MMFIELRLLVRRQGRRWASRNWTLSCMMLGDVTMLAKWANFLVQACLELRRLGIIFRRLRKWSKSICPKMSCIVEENFLVQVFSPCHIVHAFGHAFKFLLKLLLPIMVSLWTSRRSMMTSSRVRQLHKIITRSRYIDFDDFLLSFFQFFIQGIKGKVKFLILHT